MNLNIFKFRKAKTPYFIAEIGINHNGQIKLAKKMIHEAKKAGADCVKFQMFHTDNLISKNAKKAPYQSTNKTKNMSQYEIIKKCELTIEQMLSLKKYCSKINIDFLCTPFDIRSIKELTKIKVDAFKVSSCNLTNSLFLEEIAKTKKPVILSTGMSSIQEIKSALKIFSNYKNNKIILLQCTSNYPAKIENSNLNTLLTYKKKFNLNVGFSDHTVGNISAITSVALGAVVIEKHFTTSKKLPGIDQSSSIEPIELKKLISDLNDAYLSLGSKDKFVSKSELGTQNALRKSLVAAIDLKKNQILTKKMVNIKRPGIGIPVHKFKNIIGKKLVRNINRDELFTNKHFNERII